MKELRTKANGGVELTRSQKAQSLLQAKNTRTKQRKWLRKQMADLSKQLYEVNKQWTNKTEDIDGINLELAGLGW
eukprot:10164149-Heterocapsa_arctica.AAC.1